MSKEQLNAKVLNKIFDVQLSNSNTAPRININDLLSRLKHEEKKEKKENYIFLGIICAVVAATGIIASL
jgi:hypothetical protein